jgi:predicted DNA binding CopG/RHH family protein
MKKENLNKKVEVRFTSSDLQRLKGLSKSANMSVSRYIRTACFNKKVEAKFTNEERSFFRNLAMIGNNLNQIAKTINSQIKDNTIEFRLTNSLDHLDFFINKLLKDDSQNY